jgi:hypothetical protein
MTAKATQFEFRHQLLVHLCVVVAAWLTYLFDPVDIVWAFVGHRPNARALERLFFAFATVLIGAGAALRTWASAYDSSKRQNGSLRHHPNYARYAGSLLFTVGLASLVPLPGFIILVGGESILVLRLILLERSPDAAPVSGPAPVPSLSSALCLESAKWGIFVAMIAFTMLLVDRVADVLILASLGLWLALNYGSLRRCFIS